MSWFIIFLLERTKLSRDKNDILSKKSPKLNFMSGIERTLFMRLY